MPAQAKRAERPANGKPPKDHLDKGGVARGERKPKKKTVTWEGLKLTLPAELPPEIAFDFVTIESDEALSTLRLVNSIVGSEQFLEIRTKVAADAKTMDRLGTLVEDILAAYGTGAGESPASDAS